MSDAIEDQARWRRPSALQRYAEFAKRYTPLIAGRIAQLRDQLAESTDTPEARAAYEELDLLRNFEPELHMLIQAVTADAVEPLQKILMESMNRCPMPHTTVFRETELDPRRDQITELWRGQHRGVWYRLVNRNWVDLELHISHDASLGEDKETWTLERRF